MTDVKAASSIVDFTRTTLPCRDKDRYADEVPAVVAANL